MKVARVLVSSFVVVVLAVAAMPQASAAPPKAIGGPDKGNYLYITQDAPGGPLYDWVDIAGSGTKATMTNCGSWTGNDVTKPIVLPFPFEFYGKQYTTFRAGSGGNILFGPQLFEDCYYYYKDAGVANTYNQWMPSNYNPNYQIAAAWSGFGMTPGDPNSGIWYKQVSSTPGESVFIVQWNNVQHCSYTYYWNFNCGYCCPPDYINAGPNTFQVKLFEKNNVIEVHHKEHARAGGTWAANYGCLSQGLEGSGTQAGKLWNGIAYMNAGVQTYCSSVSYMPPAKWAIRYVRDKPPVAAFENYSVPPNIYHNGRLNDDSAPLPMPETSYFHPGNLILFQDRSTDDDGPIKNWTWDFGDKSVKTAANYKKDTTHIYTNETAQSYTVSLTVSDGYISHKVIKVVTTEPNEPPTIKIGVPDDGVAGEPVRFKDLSIDTDGAIDQWLWDFGDNSVSTEQNPEHTYSKAGTYKVTLHAKDDDGEADTVYQTVSVAPSVATGNNQALLDPPVAEAGAQQRVLPGSTVKLYGYQVNGHAEVYRWAQVEGPLVELSAADTSSPTFVAPQLVPDASGRIHALRLTFSLAVTDRGRTSQPDTVTILVAPLDQPPIARAQASSDIVQPGTPVALSSLSTDADEDALAHQWTQVLGPAVELVGASAVQASFIAPQVDETTDLAFQLLVDDGQGMTDATTIKVTVEPGTPLFTIGNRGAGLFAFVPVEQAQEYAWDFGDGATSTQAAPQHQYAADGRYTVRLTMLDLDGNYHTSASDVEVHLQPQAADGAAAGSRPAGALAPAMALLALVVVVLALRRK